MVKSDSSGKIKLIKGAASAPITHVVNCNDLGIDAWMEAELVNPGDTGLAAVAGIAEHPSKRVFEYSGRAHQFVYILDGDMTVQNVDNGAVYKGTKGDLFYWGPDIKLRIGGAFRYYYVKTPVTTRWINNEGDVKAVDLLSLENEAIYQGAIPDEVRPGIVEEGRSLPELDVTSIKLIKDVKGVEVFEVAESGGQVDRDWWHVNLLDGVEANLALRVGISNHRSAGMVYCEHKWHQIVLVLNGYMEVHNMDTGEVFKAKEGDLYYWAPGMRHRVGGEFKVLSVTIPARLRWFKTPNGNVIMNLAQRLDDEMVLTGHPPEEYRSESI